MTIIEIDDRYLACPNCDEKEWEFKETCIRCSYCGYWLPTYPLIIQCQNCDKVLTDDFERENQLCVDCWDLLNHEEEEDRKIAKLL